MKFSGESRYFASKQENQKGKQLMKSKLIQRQILGLNHAWKRNRRGHLSAVSAAGVLLLLNLSGSAVIAQGVDACAQTSDDALAACRGVAQSDYKVALGKCVNISDPAARAACQRQAATHLSHALDTCRGGLEVRQVACQKLGPAPYDPVIDPANFVTTINNPLFPLVPGTTFIYEDHFGGNLMRDEFAVTHNTRVIDGVTCVVVHDSVFTNGVLTEDTLDFHAQDTDGNVWYFGENTQELVDGLINTIAGTFMAGVNGDKPGIIMKAHPAVGDFYRQEFSLSNAEDFAETLSLNEVVTVPFGTFNHCLKSQEKSPLEPDVLEDKFYAPGVGNILTVDVHTGERTELVRIITGQ
jgi:hypothetical protein